MPKKLASIANRAHSARRWGCGIEKTIHPNDDLRARSGLTQSAENRRQSKLQGPFGTPVFG
jgi:hypothetical protein